MRSLSPQSVPGNLTRRKRGAGINLRTGTLALLALIFLAGCSLLPEKVSYNDPRVRKLLKAAERSSECRFAFTPVSHDADMRLEKAAGPYDLMLHVSGATNRTIAFRVDEREIRWIGEQEIYTGPKKYTNVDGTFNEKLTVTFEVESVSGAELNCLNIRYSGDDPRLAGQDDLELETILPILHEWGYDVELIGAPIEGKLIHLGPRQRTRC